MQFIQPEELQYKINQMIQVNDCEQFIKYLTEINTQMEYITKTSVFVSRILMTNYEQEFTSMILQKQQQYYNQSYIVQQLSLLYVYVLTKYMKQQQAIEYLLKISNNQIETYNNLVVCLYEYYKQNLDYGTFSIINEIYQNYYINALSIQQKISCCTLLQQILQISTQDYEPNSFLQNQMQQYMNSQDGNLFLQNIIQYYLTNINNDSKHLQNIRYLIIQLSQVSICFQFQMNILQQLITSQQISNVQVIDLTVTYFNNVMTYLNGTTTVLEELYNRPQYLNFVNQILLLANKYLQSQQEETQIRQNVLEQLENFYQTYLFQMYYIQSSDNQEIIPQMLELLSQNILDFIKIPYIYYYNQDQLGYLIQSFMMTYNLTEQQIINSIQQSNSWQQFIQMINQIVLLKIDIQYSKQIMIQLKNIIQNNYQDPILVDYVQQMVYRTFEELTAQQIIEAEFSLLNDEMQYVFQFLLQSYFVTKNQLTSFALTQLSKIFDLNYSFINLQIFMQMTTQLQLDFSQNIDIQQCQQLEYLIYNYTIGQVSEKHCLEIIQNLYNQNNIYNYLQLIQNYISDEDTDNFVKQLIRYILIQNQNLAQNDQNLRYQILDASLANENLVIHDYQLLQLILQLASIQIDANTLDLLVALKDEDDQEIDYQQIYNQALLQLSDRLTTYFCDKIQKDQKLKQIDFQILEDIYLNQQQLSDTIYLFIVQQLSISVLQKSKNYDVLMQLIQKNDIQYRIDQLAQKYCQYQQQLFNIQYNQQQLVQYLQQYNQDQPIRALLNLLFNYPMFL